MEKPCTDQLVGKLVTLLQETDPDKFDDAVVQARNQLTAEQKQAKHTDLEKLFDTQIVILKDRDVPEQIIELLQSQKNAVVEKASKMTIGDSNIAFLPVIKPVYLGYYGLMSLVRHESKKGFVYLNPAAITDQVETPDVLYYIFDVEDGHATLGKNPEAAEEIIKQQKRSPLTAAEVINLCVVTDVLSRHHVLATGSRWVSADRAPYVYLESCGRPRLNWAGVGESYDLLGFASCGSR